MRRIRRPSHATVVAYIALFIALSGGTAVALSGTNTVFTDDIANDNIPASGGNPAGGLAAADLRPASVGSSEVANNSLTGGDIFENSLDRVPHSVISILGGLGRSDPNSPFFCDPESTAFVHCSAVTLSLPAPSRVLLIGHAHASSDDNFGFAYGTCQFSAAGYGVIRNSQADVGHEATKPGEQMAFVAVSDDLFPAGSNTFRLSCNEQESIWYNEARITAVALSGS